MEKAKTYKIVTKTKEFLSKTDKAKGVTLAKDAKGYFIFTHRAASRRYPSIAAIPKKTIEFIESTG